MTDLGAVNDAALQRIAEKVYNNERLTEEDGFLLFEKGELSFVGSLAAHVAERLHGKKVYFNRNFHIEPTNVCIFTCNFCSYSRQYKHRDEGWELTQQQMLDIVRKYDGQPVTEVHIVGGVHPKMNLEFFCETIRKIKAHRPDLHIKGFTAVELDYMFRKAKLSVEEGMKALHEAGLQSLPGGGAEIFHPEVREQICADKVDGTGWLHIHEDGAQPGHAHQRHDAVRPYRKLRAPRGPHGAAAGIAGQDGRLQLLYSR